MSIASLPVDVVRRILAASTVPALLRFSSTCRAADALVTEELNFRYDSLLSKYVNDGPAFRDALGTSCSVIAGSAAAAVCGIPNTYVPGDLDIYCDEDGTAIMRDVLVTKEHYEVMSVRHQSQYTPSGSALRAAEVLIPITDLDRIYQMRLLEKQSSSDNIPNPAPAFNDNEYTSGISDIVHLRRGNFYIDLVTSSMPSSTFPVVNFWSTAPMRLIAPCSTHFVFLPKNRRSSLHL
ncbi:hypothetical protein GSI_12824 [Ganoderma sinense ZZ0214-1]|uniref:F-box domain-containing protein n=1 Tax=Ganoderma sinense ZZ0214-1 TaxID=1077348 RepID=A0A2G8RTT6_9APHY|nr:hypothetical protein GSI_12824 [Ganoderma sinense ZZ0214-1]